MQNVFLFLLLLIQNVCSSNILYVSSMPFRSYYMWNQKLAFEFVERGHNVTFVKTFKSDLFKTENYTEILIEGVQETIQNSTENLLKKEPYTAARFIPDFTNFCVLLCQTSAKSTGLSRLLNAYKNFKFDLIFFDVTAGTCFHPLIKKFDYPPTIGVTQFPLPTFVGFSFGNQLNPSYIPWHGVTSDNKMSFFKRVWNFVLTYLELGVRYNKQYIQEHQIAQTVFGKNIPPMEDLERHISLIFLNTHPILNYAQPLAPNIIPVAGLHITQPKTLPQELQEILDGAENGVIVFSLGTMVIWKELSQIRKNLLDAFSQIPETVLWKYDDDIENVPKNVIVRKWFPQNDILGHSNVKLLVAHGGALSAQEALYHGVPILCIPFYRDQHHTANIIVKRKFGVSLTVDEIETKLVLQKLEEVLGNPMYSKNMKKASRMFRNRKETSLETATFWVEYLLEYRDLDFLSTSARDLPFYKLLCLDVLLFLMSVVVILIVLSLKLLQFILVIVSRKGKVKLN